MNAINISPDGAVSAIYDDSLRGALDALGEVSIRRASHVESAGGLSWTADMGPVGGPVLGPFPSREEALAAERLWLESRGY